MIFLYARWGVIFVAVVGVGVVTYSPPVDIFLFLVLFFVYIYIHTYSFCCEVYALFGWRELLRIVYDDNAITCHDDSFLLQYLRQLATPSGGSSRRKVKVYHRCLNFQIE